MENLPRKSCTTAIKDLATYNVQKGSEISIFPAATFDENLNQLLAINSLLSIILYQRKTLTLHASCVQIKGSAVAFLGDSGCGKSLLAGALCARGNRLINDDIVPVQLFNRSVIAYPGYPMIKMIPREATLLGFSTKAVLFCIKMKISMPTLSKITFQIDLFN